MGDTQQPPSAGSGLTGAEAAAELAEIQRRQGQVIKAVLVPGWYWWVMAAAIVAIGAARDSGDPVVQAIIIPLAALVIAVLIIATIPAVRRRVQVHSATQPDARAAAAIFGMILLVDGVIIGTAASLAAARVPHPITIGSAAGAAVLVIVGPLVNRYARWLMLSQARQQMNHARRPEAAPHQHGTP
jgi:quinol-cytochrome oxidoreductase complex cytochrome b subunit